MKVKFSKSPFPETLGVLLVLPWAFWAMPLGWALGTTVVALAAPLVIRGLCGLDPFEAFRS